MSNIKKVNNIHSINTYKHAHIRNIIYLFYTSIYSVSLSQLRPDKKCNTFDWKTEREIACLVSLSRLFHNLGPLKDKLLLCFFGTSKRPLFEDLKL